VAVAVAMVNSLAAARVVWVVVVVVE
jgi:hypothetical protein